MLKRSSDGQALLVAMATPTVAAAAVVVTGTHMVASPATAINNQ